MRPVCRNCGCGEEHNRQLFEVHTGKYEHGSAEQCIRELRVRMERLIAWAQDKGFLDHN